jgi:hypothetical protein
MIGGTMATLAGSVMPPGKHVDISIWNANCRAGCAYSDRPIGFNGDLAAAQLAGEASLFKGAQKCPVSLLSANATLP